MENQNREPTQDEVIDQKLRDAENARLRSNYDYARTTQFEEGRNILYLISATAPPTPKRESR